MSVLKQMFSRGRVMPLVLIFVIFMVWKWRQKQPLVTFEGTTFGTIAYHIKYKDSKNRNFKLPVDSLLAVFNSSLNHYLPDSELSLFNRDSVITFQLPFFLPVLKKSKQIYDESLGAFNPAVMPLVNAWGFGPGKSSVPDSTTIDSLLTLVDFTKINFDSTHVWKLDSRIQLDFSAIAKGYAVDVLVDFLNNKGIDNLFVEIGGEVSCMGTNARNKPWEIGVLDPASDLLHQSYIATASLENKALATSANNFNFIIRDGIRYTHTIDPKSGYPAQSNMLSASVFASDCMTADAFATAFMTVGFEQTKSLLKNLAGIDAFLIYSNEDGSVSTFATDNIRNQIQLIDNNK